MILCCVFFCFQTGCAPPAAPTPFVPPQAAGLHTTPDSQPANYTPPPQPASQGEIPKQLQPAGDLSACADNLRYIEDVTVPDGTVVAPGESIEKIWRVENNGTCGWGKDYRLGLVGGSELGVTSPQALYPARAGSVVEIRIVFTAPPEPGYQRTAWQAFSPNGTPFGDQIYMDVVVQNP
jgi:hypothetical protein